MDGGVVGTVASRCAVTSAVGVETFNKIGQQKNTAYLMGKVGEHMIKYSTFTMHKINEPTPY